jgi:hypothetical protein
MRHPVAESGFGTSKLFLVFFQKTLRAIIAGNACADPTLLLHGRLPTA